MPLSLPFVWSDDCLLHEPEAEIWIGTRAPATEVPERATRIREALLTRGAHEVSATPHGDDALHAVHDPHLVEFLRTAWDSWDLPSDRVVPYVFAQLADEPATPVAIQARAGLFAYDTMTLIGPGTWEAARAAVDVALTAVDLVAGGIPVAYACCRPPGHHVTRTRYGGSCYLNNTAVAAAELQRRLDCTVAVLDIDAHHGNGTQDLFRGRPEIRTASVHVDPGAGWFPHFAGFAAENDQANLNLPVPPGTGDEAWLAAVSEAAAFARDAGALVVALGVDAAAADPESPLRVTADGYCEAGRVLGELGVPTVVVQEGGYDLAAIGELVAATLGGLTA